MKINVNSLKMHHLFAKETLYNIVFVESEDKSLFQKLYKSENLNLIDNIEEKDIEYVTEIIKIKKQLKKIIPHQIFNEIDIQVNINDYFDHDILSKQKISSKHDLSSMDMYAMPDDNVIIFGTHVLENKAAIQDIMKDYSNAQYVQFSVLHELSHVLEERNREIYPLLQTGSFLDKLMSFIAQKDNKIHSGDKITNLLSTLAMEMYADSLSALLSVNLEYIGSKEYFLNQIIANRKNESHIGLLQDFSNTPGVMSTHFTLNALEKIKSDLSEEQSFEKMDLSVQKAVRYGIMKHILFMTTIEELKPEIVDLFNKVLPHEVSIEQLQDELKKEVGTVNFEEMMNQLIDENINKSSGKNRNKFIAVFHPEDWKKENTPMPILDKDALKSFLANRILRQREMYKEVKYIKNKLN